MSLSFRSVLVRSLLLTGAVAGCNSILDNNPGKLQQNVTPNPAQDAGGQTPINTEPVKEPTPAGPGGCGELQHQCGGTCAATNDPNYGCGTEGCKPCSIAHGTPACAGTGCAVAKCDAGYADCNGNAEDGCEVDLSKPASCGACNAVCPATASVCAPKEGSFQCVSQCAPDAPLQCGNECVSPLTSLNHCGACNAKCPDVPNSTPSCTLGQCGFTCAADFNKCGTACTVKTDPAACGPTCVICPAAANAVPSCAADTCGFTCNADFGNCNNDPVDGCETPLKTDPLHCGVCGTNCGTGTCVNGLCQPATDPDAGVPPG